jgi:hypothetical protein
MKRRYNATMRKGHSRDVFSFKLTAKPRTQHGEIAFDVDPSEPHGEIGSIWRNVERVTLQIPSENIHASGFVIRMQDTTITFLPVRHY